MKNIKKIIANFLVVLTIGIGLSGMAFAAETVDAESTRANIEEFLNTYRVNAYKTRTHKYLFYAGETVDIEIDGDGDTNLDLYVYDAKGNLCVKRTGATDFESLTMDVYRSEYFTIKVVNRGKYYNLYDLYVGIY